MKIAIFSDTFPPQVNGVAHMVLNSALALSKQGHTVRVYTVSQKSSEELTQNMNGALTVVAVPSLGFPAYPGERLTLPLGFAFSKIKDFEPDIIHVHTPFAVGIEGVVSAKMHKIPVVGTHHTFFDHYLKHVYLEYDWAKKISWEVTVAFYNRCDRVISPTASLAHELKTHGLTKPVTELFNTVDADLFQHTENAEKQNEIKKRFGIAGKSIVYMGRLSYEKSINEIITFFPHILKEMPGTKFMIVGDGPEKENLQKISSDLGLTNDVIFTGFLRGEDLVDALSINDLYVTTSKSENMPLAVIEAEAVGLPIVAFSSLGMNEIIIDGKNGFLVSPDKPEEILQRILEIMRDDTKRKSFSDFSKEFSKKYSEVELTKKLVGIYTEVIHSKK